jgi:hypothetical protein
MQRNVARVDNFTASRQGKEIGLGGRKEELEIFF